MYMIDLYMMIYQEVFIFLTDYSKILYKPRLRLRFGLRIKLRIRLRGNCFPQHHSHQTDSTKLFIQQHTIKNTPGNGKNIWWTTPGQDSTPAATIKGRICRKGWFLSFSSNSLWDWRYISISKDTLIVLYLSICLHKNTTKRLTTD